MTGRFDNARILFPAKKSTAGALCFIQIPLSEGVSQAIGVTGQKEPISGCDDIVSGRGLNLLPD
jgi:hypothetical protein